MWLQRREKLDIMLGAARHIMHAEAFASLAVWHSHAMWKKGIRQKIQRALGAFQFGTISKAYLSWQSYSYTRQSRMAILMRCASAFQNLALHKGFETWVRNLYGSAGELRGKSPVPESNAEGAEGSEGGSFAELA
jgi:hypothetical protein